MSEKAVKKWRSQTKQLLNAKRLKSEIADDGSLDLSMSEICQLPAESFQSLTKLKHLDLSNNAIVALPANFGNCLLWISSLDLSQNQLQSLPDSICLMERLKKLDLYKNRICKLPTDFGSLKTLDWLDLKGNPLDEALSKAAGTCSDDGQCRACAKNVRRFMAAVKAELIRRRTCPPPVASTAPPAESNARKRKLRKKMAKARQQAETEKTDVVEAEVEDEPAVEPNTPENTTAHGGHEANLFGFFVFFILFVFLSVLLVYYFIFS